MSVSKLIASDSGELVGRPICPIPGVNKNCFSPAKLIRRKDVDSILVKTKNGSVGIVGHEDRIIKELASTEDPN